MKIIKHYWKHDGKYHALIRTNCYCHKLSHIQELFQCAIKDYPPLQAYQTDVVVYGGDTIKGIWGIEFPIDKPVEGYDEIDWPVCTL